MLRQIWVVLVLAVGSLTASAIWAASLSESSITAAIEGKATAADKQEIGKLFRLLSNLAQTPDNVKMKDIVAVTGAVFKDPMCFKQSSGANSCSHDNVNWDIKTYAITVVRTVGQKHDSDRGAQVIMQISRDFACVPTHALDEFWGVEPIRGADLMPDSFAGDSKPLELVQTTLYKGINRNDAYVYVETRSIANCVVNVLLSTLRPTN